MTKPSTLTGQATRIKSTFAMQYSVSINIKAPADKIWALLTNAAEYPNWNSTVTKVEGSIVKGEKIKVFAKVNPDRAFPVTVAELDAPHKMVWKGGMPLGLFKGIRTFQLRPQDDGSVNLSMREDFGGLMLPMIAGTMPDLRPAFEGFAADLKHTAEQG